MANKLEQARKIINEVDAEMAALFIKRMRAAEMVYEHKKEYGLPILDQKREEQVIAANASLIEDETIRGYYIDHLKNLMSLSRAYQYRMQQGLRVACCGVTDSISHIASGRIFPESTLIACRDCREAYDSVCNGSCDVAVLPIENSCTDEADQTLDLIFSGDLYINGIYELGIQEAGSSGGRENTTRFAVLSRVMANSPSLCSSVLMFTLRHEADSLDAAIRIIEQYGYKMTAPRSSPLKEHSRQHYFYIELNGTIRSDHGADMMEQLGQVCDRLKIAGTFAPHTEI